MNNYGTGCECFPGWKGKSCAIPNDQCEDPTCSGFGECLKGTCICQNGHEGVNCENISCSTECSENGVCLPDGFCRCFSGYSGASCDIPSSENISACENGVWLSQSDRCVCDDDFEGENCETLKSPLVSKMSKCDPICENGGSCYLNNGKWSCQCPENFHGTFCHVKKELECDDGRDNDNDGLADCLDPDCCHDEKCKNADFCQETPKVTYSGKSESFSAQVRSIVSKLQNNSRLSPTGPVFLVHGMVRDKNLIPMSGVAISSKSGKSYSRKNGEFQLAVEGVCSEITFSRPGFRLFEKIVCPNTDFYAIPPVRMEYQIDQPVLYRLPQPSEVSIQTDFSARLFENQVPLRLPVNVQTRQPDYLLTVLDGTMKLRLMNPDPVSKPVFLQIIPSARHLEILTFCNGAKIGHQSVQTSELEVFLDFSWDFRDFFGAEVFGLGTCEVLVGARYDLVSDFIWSRAIAKVAGKRPEKFQKSDFGRFRAAFDSFFDVRNNLLYHVGTNIIQMINFGHQKELFSEVNLEQIDAIEKFDGIMTIFSKSTGIWQKSSQSGTIRRFFQAPDSIGFAANQLTSDLFLTYPGKILKIKSSGDSDVIYRHPDISGPITVDKLGNIFFLRNKAEIFRLRGVKLDTISKYNRSILREPPCIGEYQRLIEVKLSNVVALEYSVTSNELIIVDRRADGNLILRVNLETDDFWTTQVSGSARHCESIPGLMTYHDELNSVKLTPGGKILFSTSSHIVEVLPSGRQQIVFGSCKSGSCEIMGQKSSARLDSLSTFTVTSSGKIFVAEESPSGKPKISELKPNKARKTSGGYQIGFPDENLLREYLTDGRLVQIKDLYTKKQIKYLKYSGSTLAAISDQFGNTVKITHESKSRILLQNSRNYQRAQIVLTNSNPTRIQDEDGESVLKWQNDKIVQLDDVEFEYKNEQLSKVRLSNLTVDLKTSLTNGMYTAGFSSPVCSKNVKFETGEFAISRIFQSEITSIVADSTLKSASSDWSDTDIFCIDSISNQPVKFALVESRGTRKNSSPKVPDRTNEWISILNKESHIKRMRREGATLMSYELDFSDRFVTKGRFYDEVKTFEGSLEIDPKGPLKKVEIEYQRSGVPVYQTIDYKYTSAGVLTGWTRSRGAESETDSISISRGRSGKISEIAPKMSKPFKINHKRNQIEIITPTGSAHLVGFKIGGSPWSENEYAVTFPTGDRFNVVRKVTEVGNEKISYSRNGIDFRTIETFPEYRRIVLINDGVKMIVEEILDCYGQTRVINLGSNERRFMVTDGALTLLYANLGTEFVSQTSKNLIQSESVISNGNHIFVVDFSFDSWHRATLTRLAISGYQTLSRKWTYERDQISSVGKFNFIHFPGNSLYQISATNPRIIFTKKYDYASGEIIAMQLEVNNGHIFNSERKSLPNGRIESEQFEILSQGNKTSLKWEYDEDGKILRSPTETFSYRNGLLDSIYSTSGIQIKIGRDHLNRLVRFGAVQLKWAASGLVKIGSNNFEWDHLGNPIKYNSHEILYDHLGRIRQIGPQSHVLYGNAVEADRVTHHIVNHVVFELFYDLSGGLFAIIKRNLISGETKQFFVICLSDNSPRFILSELGDVVKEIQFSAHGRIIFDSNPSFDLILGHRGHICLNGHVCFDPSTRHWRETLTGEGVTFNPQVALLDKIAHASRDENQIVTGVTDQIWPYHSPLKFTFVDSRKDRILRTYFDHLKQPILPNVL